MVYAASGDQRTIKMLEKTVLLVEDDPALRLLGARQLEHLGVKCELAVNGIEAVEKAGCGYALILMDLGLPEMDGIQAAMRIREDEQRTRRWRTPIIALTAFSDEERPKNVGMDDIVRKPALIEDVKRALMQWAPQVLPG